MLHQFGLAGAPHYRTQRDRDDDRIVGVAENRDEVGHEVDRHG